MNNGSLALIMVIIVTLGLFVMIFGINYLARRERMAMIERSIDPRSFKPRSAPYQNLKWGLLLIGSGLGLFIAYILHHRVFNDSFNDDTFFLYLALIAIFGGAGLFISYRIEKREVLDKEDQRFEK